MNRFSAAKAIVLIPGILSPQAASAESSNGSNSSDSSITPPCASPAHKAGSMDTDVRSSKVFQTVGMIIGIADAATRAVVALTTTAGIDNP